MELKSLQDWVISKYIKSAPDVVDDSSFGGITREYQVRVDPDKLVSYGLSLAQVEQQLTNSNANGGGSFIEQGSQQINVRAVGLVRNVAGHRKDRPQDAERHAACASRILRWSRRGRRFVWAKSARRSIAPTAWWWTTTMSSRASCSCAKARTRRPRMDGIHAMVQQLNDHILPPGVKIVPYLDRDDLVHYTTHTVLHNLAEGMILVVIILFIFLGNVRGALIVSLTIPFALAVCFHLSGPAAHFRQPAFAGRAGFRHGGGWRGGDGGKHRPPSEPARRGSPHACWSGFAKPRTKCSGRFSTRSPSSSPPICRSSRCSGSKESCSSRWPGRWRSRCWAR